MTDSTKSEKEKIVKQKKETPAALRSAWPQA